MVLTLSENWTIMSGRDVQQLVRWAREAEDAGFDGVMIGEHIVLGPDADAQGRMANPREDAMPGNQDPATPWPSPIGVLSAIAAVTERIRLIAGAVLAPLRHPLLLAKELATLDLLSSGRLVVLPTVSWSRDEYAALGVPFERRGELLDDHLAAWQVLWQDSPADFEGKHYRFQDVYLEPKPFRPSGPDLWFGGSKLHGRTLSRIARYGVGLHLLTLLDVKSMQEINNAMSGSGRTLSELEFVGGVPAVFRDDHPVADLDRALEVIPFLLAYGFGTFCIKPAQFLDDPSQIGPFCKDVMRKVTALAS
ncbi:TIGR03619 family F420-dependent LLM class oxidoreductase [Actinobacteria bacterium YIM 96077]|uniref:F420-dependent oxidoreductase n=2 Tax=Phytoactinopolyspora halophila TaxID=1981511 RepID=A0A329QN34_9ACTN|nr:TIGR03619 family F420-dependent LLM class oxidoreductase [Actinobacteria bacterium YIM 96077]RAW13764.1 F420-dependent oxidoreductase [Phytoactinopolyspora halophila]